MLDQERPTSPFREVEVTVLGLRLIPQTEVTYVVLGLYLVCVGSNILAS